jgi:hypothetical protein
MPKISFTNNVPFSNKESVSMPRPIIKEIPEWYREFDRYAMLPNGTPYIGPDGGKMPTWKACPAVYDTLGSGYALKTPCDIEFFINDQNQIDAKVLDRRYGEFLQKRPAMPGFKVPIGYHENHFAWYPDWAVSVPKGYSVIYTTPMNRFDLPFMNSSGIIDNDSVGLPGTMPFFVVKGWEGILPAGTTYMQMIPFKREDWKSESSVIPMQEIYKRQMNNSMKYRKPNGGIYQKEVWSRRKYE